MCEALGSTRCIMEDSVLQQGAGSTNGDRKQLINRLHENPLLTAENAVRVRSTPKQEIPVAQGAAPQVPEPPCKPVSSDCSKNTPTHQKVSQAYEHKRGPMAANTVSLPKTLQPPS